MEIKKCKRENSVFDRLKTEKTERQKKFFLIVFGVILAAAVVTVAFYFVKTRPEKTPAVTSNAPVAEVDTRIDEISGEIGTDLSVEYADMFLSEIDRLLAKTDDPNQTAMLEDLRFAAYFNSGRYEDAIEAGEAFLAQGVLSEAQRFHIYDKIADTYAQTLRNPSELEKYVRLLLNSSALSERDDADSFPIYYISVLKEQGVDYEE
jgi:hypothetical protein